MENKQRILLCEDEESLGMLLREYLQAKGYDAELYLDGEAGYRAFTKGHYDMCLFDVMMPKMDGFTLAKEIRLVNQDIPIIFLTAKNLKDDILDGFKVGADDYLTKPFNILELKARIRALLRRAGAASTQAANILSIGTVTLDLDARNAYRSGVLADLTAKEFDMIELLMRNPNRVYSREALLDKLWTYEYRSDIRTVDVHIRRLREKLEENPAEPKYIMTKWGVGYYFKK